MNNTNSHRCSKILFLLGLFIATMSGYAAVESDLVVSYPPSTVSSWGGEANAEVNTAVQVAGSNALNDQSGTGEHFRIAGYVMSGRDSNGEDNNYVLSLVANDASYADVRNYAAGVGADQVMYIPYASTGSAGNAYQPGTYSACGSTWFWLVVVAHEAGGHNYGASHNDGMVSPKTIMMHNYCGGGAAWPYLYSNPNVWNGGVQLLGPGWDEWSCYISGYKPNGGDNANRISSVCQGMCDTTLRVVYAPVLTNTVLHWCFTNAPGSAPAGTTNYDLVSGAPAVVRGIGATYTGSALRIPGGTTGNVAMNSMSAYVDLPNGIISSRTNITIEIWATPLSAPNWARIMDFGRTTQGGDVGGSNGEWSGLPGTAAPGTTSGYDEIMLSCANGSGDITQQRLLAGLNGSWINYDTSLATTAGVQHHYALTFTDGAGVYSANGGRWQWYRDGDAVAFLDVSNHLSAYHDVNNWLGRSLWSGDSNANNDYTEVRVSNVAMNQKQVMANYLVGPNYVPRSTTLVAGDLWNGGTRSFNSAGNWSDGLAPGAGKSYDMYDFNLTTPNTTSPYTFGGDSLHGGGGIFFYSASGSSTITINKFQIDNEEICNSAAVGSTFTLAGNLYVTNNNVLRGTGGPINVSANLIGNGSFTLYASPVSFTGNNTNFTGKIRVGNGITGSLSLSSEAQLGANPPSFTSDQLILNRGWLYTTTSFAINNPNRGITIGVNNGIFDVAGGTTLTLGCPLSSGYTSIAGNALSVQTQASGIVAGVLVKQNTGTLVLTNANANYNGAISINGGTLSIGASGQLSGGSFGNPFTDNGVFDYSSSANQTIASSISGTGAITKNGSGTLTLSGANTYTGTTTVSAGTLLVSGSIGSGAVTVASGAAMGGSGTIGGPITLQSGAVLSPGTGLGILTVNSNITMQSGSTTAVEINAMTLTNDQLLVSGAITFGGTLSVTNLAGTLAAGNTFTLFRAANYSGAFSTMNLPALSSGLSWNFNSANGVLSVISSGSPPPTPTGLVAIPGNAQAGLVWNSSPGATSYSVKRATTSGGPYATIASPSSASYTDTSVANGTTYYYVVSAVNAYGESANSSQASATPQPPIPPVPTGLMATRGNAQAALTWNASTGATSYNIKRSTVSGGSYSTSRS